MRYRWGFGIGVVLSLAIHAGFAILVPAPSPEALPRREYHVVELRNLDIPLPDLPPELPRKPSRAKRATPVLGPPPVPLPEEVPPPVGLRLRDMATAVRIPEMEGIAPKPPEISIPDLVKREAVIPPERIGRETAPKGVPEGSRLDGPLPTPVPTRVLPGKSEELQALRSRLIEEELLKAGESEAPESVIQGPAASRRLVLQPPPPQFPEGGEGEIELKFWVLSDGTVGRIVLLKRGQLVLEAAAIQYLKQWKFNSLPLGSDLDEQWGTIRFRFLSAAAGPTSSAR